MFSPVFCFQVACTSTSMTGSGHHVQRKLHQHSCLHAESCPQPRFASQPMMFLSADLGFVTYFLVVFAFTACCEQILSLTKLLSGSSESFMTWPCPWDLSTRARILLSQFIKNAPPFISDHLQYIFTFLIFHYP